MAKLEVTESPFWFKNGNTPILVRRIHLRVNGIALESIRVRHDLGANGFDIFSDDPHIGRFALTAAIPDLGISLTICRAFLARRVVATVDFDFGELFPRVGFIATNLDTNSRAVVRFYNHRGTAEQ